MFGLLEGRAQRPIPPRAARILAEEIPEHFLDDGCSNSPDRIFGFDFRWSCKIHDWRYCGRCHPAGTMHYQNKLTADQELRENLKASLPWRWRWVSRVYWRGVQIGGGFDAWNSCGPENGDACRHGIARPTWMLSGNVER